jgi:hypothetical protein
MNLLLCTSRGVLSFESEHYLRLGEARGHIVTCLPIDVVASYAHFAPESNLALIDAIVCVLDTEFIDFQNPRPFLSIYEAIWLAEDVRALPRECTMFDGRKWSSTPFILFSNSWNYALQRAASKFEINGFRLEDPMIALRHIESVVDKDKDRLLKDYVEVGFMLRFERGRAQIGRAFERKEIVAETEFYYAAGDRRQIRARRWLTIKRDMEGIQNDVEMFEMLLNRDAREPEIHRFFEEHPSILMEARLGIPISHRPNFANPRGEKPDFIVSPVLGPLPGHQTEILELKRPGEKILRDGFHSGFSSKVTRAVDQVRDYRRNLHAPENVDAVLKSLGYIPTQPRLAVLIGRAPRSREEKEVLRIRQSELLDVRVIDYDEVLNRQVGRLSRQAYKPFSIEDVDAW